MGHFGLDVAGPNLSSASRFTVSALGFFISVGRHASGTQSLNRMW
jgi:hypothetical protein